MKKFVLLILTLCVLDKAVGQTTCLSRSEFQAAAKQLTKDYMLVEKIIDPAFGVAPTGMRLVEDMTPAEKKRLELHEQFGKTINQVLKNANLLQDTTCSLNFQLYASPDGSLQKVYYEVTPNGWTNQPDTLTANRLKLRIDSVLCPWFSTYRFPVTGDKPYRFATGMRVGKLPSKRKLRRGPGILTTIEAAEKTARPDTVKHLVFNTLELQQIPEVIYRFPNLEVLDLSINSISVIPEKVFTIPKLKQLNVSGNPLGNDGLHVARNKHLKILNIQSTKITVLPKAVTRNRRLESLWLGLNDFSGGLNTAPLRRMRRLKDLNLYKAKLNEVPSAIRRLKRLEVLDLYYNNLRTIPESVCRMRRLQQLAVSNNKLNELPPNIGRMKKLQVLYAHHNLLGNVPTGFQKLYHLRILDIGHNAFFTVPDPVLTLPFLEELDISHNRLTDLPAHLTQVRTLKKLYVRGNPASEQKTLSVALIKQLEGNQTEVFY